MRRERDKERYMPRSDHFSDMQTSIGQQSMAGSSTVLRIREDYLQTRITSHFLALLLVEHHLPHLRGNFRIASHSNRNTRLLCEVFCSSLHSAENREVLELTKYLLPEHTPITASAIECNHSHQQKRACRGILRGVGNLIPDENMPF
jgi:hypothetical protein